MPAPEGSRPYGPDAGPPGGALFLRLFDSFAAARPLWDAMRPGSVSTAYQSHAWVSTYFQHVGRPAGAQALVVALVDGEGAPQLLLPLQVETKLGLRIARCVGGAHANFNMPVLAAGTPLPDADVLRRLLMQAGRSAGLDLFALVRQPVLWRGRANPLAALDSRRSASDGHALTLGPASGGGFAVRMSKDRRRKLLQKRRILETQAGISHHRARSGDEAAALLDVFFVQKTRRMRALGLDDPFAPAGIQAFLRSGARFPDPDGAPLIELHALQSRFGILAIYGLLLHEDGCSALFNSFDGPPDIVRHGPGLVLLHDIVHDLARRGCSYFDMGAGDAPYKQEVCNEPLLLADSLIPVTAKGRLAAGIGRQALGLKGTIKRSPRLWQAVGRLRRLRAG